MSKKRVAKTGDSQLPQHVLCPRKRPGTLRSAVRMKICMVCLMAASAKTASVPRSYRATPDAHEVIPWAIHLRPNELEKIQNRSAILNFFLVIFSIGVRPATDGRVPLRTVSRDLRGGQRDPLRRYLRNGGRFERKVKSGHFKAS